jgi:hypothetical protein
MSTLDYAGFLASKRRSVLAILSLGLEIPA